MIGSGITSRTSHRKKGKVTLIAAVRCTCKVPPNVRASSHRSKGCELGLFATRSPTLDHTANHYNCVHYGAIFSSSQLLVSKQTPRPTAWLFFKDPPTAFPSPKSSAPCCLTHHAKQRATGYPLQFTHQQQLYTHLLFSEYFA